MKSNQYDIVIFGATSFVGKLICEYMIEQFPSDEVSWVLAGRSEPKLNELKRNLGNKAKDLAIIVADANDLDAL